MGFLWINDKNGNNIDVGRASIDAGGYHHDINKVLSQYPSFT